MSGIKSHIAGEIRQKNTILSYKAIIIGDKTEESTAGVTLTLNVNSCRMSVVQAFLKTGTPFPMLNPGS